MLPSVLPSHCVLALASLLAASPVPSEARPSAEAAPQVHELRFNWTRDGLITGAGAVLWIGSEALFKDDLAPATCRWCDRAPDGTDRLNRLDRWGRGLAGSTPEARKRADTWSNIVDFGLLPAGVLGAQYALAHGSGADRRIFFEDAGIIIESAVLAAVLNQTVKFIAGRERPFVHVLPEDEKGLTAHPTDNNLSFYSGHTTLAFALVVSAGTVAELRGYKHRGWIWAVGLPVATSVGLLRMGADKHYLTDVATGAVMGTAFGLAVPLLLHGRREDPRPQETTLRVSAGPRGAVLMGRF
ncbi:phosphatase PAP2 family protein [Hyalangium rubrum]|uniref:Phosphatase PAP2 family protein n=1 Tax=Hyalangium rubrum TaxID=3103134 RepID=A0ABU5GWP0_9BACT|nr:phosphatase PAP2 family protein [Hyalangium sp. s54d21]MDY7225264.1 phosphatase PAP2 family protein [Hyalangium sp. s54d21]